MVSLRSGLLGWENWWSSSLDLTGATWTTTAVYLKAGTACSSMFLTRNTENHHNDIRGSYDVISDSSGAVVSSNIYDLFGLLTYSQGAAVTKWRDGLQGDEGIITRGSQSILPGRAVILAFPIIIIIVVGVCAVACLYLFFYLRYAFTKCAEECNGDKDKIGCFVTCVSKKVGEGGFLPIIGLLTCMFCICLAITKNPVRCLQLLKKEKEIIT